MDRSIGSTSIANALKGCSKGKDNGSGTTRYIRYNPVSHTYSGIEKEGERERERSVLASARTASQSLSQWDQHMPPHHLNSGQRLTSHALLNHRHSTAGCMEDYLNGVIAHAAHNVMNDFTLLNEKVSRCGDIVLPR